MARRYRPSRRDIFELRGVDARTEEFFGPFSSVPRFDDVTGDPLPVAQMGIQRGLIKNTNPLKGSWDTKSPIPVIYSTYDPSEGIASKPAGQYDDTYSV